MSHILAGAALVFAATLASGIRQDLPMDDRAVAAYQCAGGQSERLAAASTASAPSSVPGATWAIITDDGSCIFSHVEAYQRTADPQQAYRAAAGRWILRVDDQGTSAVFVVS